MDLSKRYQAFVDYFATRQPNPKSELRYETPFQLLIAVILSAQCTDKRVNIVTKSLFAQYPDAERMAKAPFEELYSYIQSISYPYNKAKYLLATAKIIAENNGALPKSTEMLQRLPGVGRKTAHVVASVLYNTPVLPVDTHVYRVARRIGLAYPTDKSMLAVEKRITRHLAPQYIAKAHHWLILHGRYICKARNPQCATCPIQKFCQYYQATHPSKDNHEEEREESH